jgi:DNA-binding transcriptional regulator YhcF (GntR family)
MILRVDPSSAVPAYEQIRAQMRLMIASGTLAEGTQLPTIRQLASDLGLAKGTVSRPTRRSSPTAAW